MDNNIAFNFELTGYGCSDINLTINDTTLHFTPTYMGRNPAESLVGALAFMEIEDRNQIDEFDECADYVPANHASFVWQSEPDGHKWTLIKRNDELQITIHYYSDSTIGRDEQNWEGKQLVLDTIVSFSQFKQVVCAEMFRVLKKYGLVGFARTWGDGNDVFPITSLLMLCGVDTTYVPLAKPYAEYFKSDFEKEIKRITTQLFGENRR